VAKYSMKMHKYKNAARDILILRKVGYSLADVLKRAVYFVSKQCRISDKRWLFHSLCHQAGFPL
jgi:hypothetical protein